METLSPEEFAEQAAEKLVEPIVDGTLSLDRERFALVIKNGTGKALQTIYLHRYYQTYKAEPSQLENILADIAMLSREQNDYSNYGKVVPHLMPVIRDYAEHYLDWCRISREYGNAAGRYEALIWCEHFVIFPVIDTGNRQSRVSSRMLESWPEDFQNVMAQAANNLISLLTSTRNHANISKK